MRAGRLLVAALAVVIVAWFVLAAREARDLVEATNIVTQSASITPAQASHASRLLTSAGQLNPDRQVDLLRAALAANRNQNGRARQLLEGVTSAEPENVQAWYLLAQVSGRDYRVEALALKRIARLHPYVP
jgi:predicted Zn-dependent protease